MSNMLDFRRMPSLGSPPSSWGYVANVYVTARHRNRGVGARLLQACTTWADDAGYARLVLNPSCPSISLYERAGFAPAADLMLRSGPS